MWSRLEGIITKEFIQLRRDSLALTLALFVPVAMLFIFGWAINTDVKHVPTAVFDQSGSVESVKLLEAFENSQYFDIRYRARSPHELTRMIDGGVGRARAREGDAGGADREPDPSVGAAARQDHPEPARGLWPDDDGAPRRPLHLRRADPRQPHAALRALAALHVGHARRRHLRVRRVAHGAAGDAVRIPDVPAVHLPLGAPVSHRGHAERGAGPRAHDPADVL